MGVYIKGMEMPKEQPLIIKISQDGTVYMSQGIYGIGHGVATAVPVPPHGRLVDGDALAAQCDDPYWCVWLSDIEAVPTIIPAEEEADESR